MTELESIVQGYRDEMTQWWILCGLTDREKREQLEMRAILWYQEAQVKAAFAETCLSILEIPPIMLPAVSPKDSSPGADLTT